MDKQSVVVINTRSGKSGAETSAYFRERGWRIEEVPLLTHPPLIPLGELFGMVDGADWLVVFSPIGAEYLAEHLRHDPRLRPKYQIAALAPATAAKLEEAGFSANFVGVSGNGQAFAREFLHRLEELSEKRPMVAVLQSKIGGSVFREQLRAAGLQVALVHLYDTVSNPEARPILQEIIERHSEGDRVFALLASPSAVRAYFEAEVRPLPRFVTIGRTTSDALRYYGVRPTCEAQTPSNAGLLLALAEYIEAFRKE